MLSDRKPKLPLLILVLCITAAGLIAGYLLLPNFIEKTARQSVLPATPFSSFIMDVRHAGLFSTEINGIVVGGVKQPALSIGSINVTYSPTGLLQKKIKQIDVNGLTLFLVMADGKLSIPGLDIANLPAEQEATPANIKLPLALKNLLIRNGILHLAINNHLELIPFDLSLTSKEPGNNDYFSITLHIYPRGEELTASADLDLAENRMGVKVSADSLQLDKFADLVSKLAGMAISGQASISAQSEINLQPMEFVSANIDIGLQPFSVDFGSIKIGSPVDDAENKPLQFTLTGNGRKLQYALQNVTLSGPLGAEFESSGLLELADHKMTGISDFSVQVSEVPPAILKDGVNLSGVANYSYNLSTGKWHLGIKPDTIYSDPSSDRKIRLQYQGNEIESEYPDFTVSGQGINNTGDLSFSASLQQIIMQHGGLSASLGVSLNGNARMLPGEPGRGGKFKASGFLELENGQLQDRKSAMSMPNINGRIPWQWPPSSTPIHGAVMVPAMYWQENDLGSFKGDISLIDTSYSLDSSYTSNLLKGLVLNIAGQAGFSDTGFGAGLRIKTQAGSFASVNLGKINPSLQDSYLNGRLAIDGSMDLNSNGLTGKMLVNMEDGTLEFTEKEYVIDGIELTMLLPSLPGYRTDPAQQLRFSKASFGNMLVSEGRVAWQLESSGAIFIEESLFKWAGGKVYANGVRISPGKDKLTVPLFCDRLKLTEILQQFGIANAEGEGTVSGRIPLVLDKDTVEFADGFLYSSPGQGGSVKVTAFDLLTAGIPKNSPQFAQIDFAAEALKNFKYNWVKLLLETTGEDLVMQMQMDGKPVQSLPFTYNSETGTFARLKGNQRGIDQPIRLDVNFRFPLNRFLGYSGKIQDLMKKIQ